MPEEGNYGMRGEKETKENMNVGNLDESSLTKTFHIFIFWGKTEGYSERGLWYYYSVCYCGKCYHREVYGAEGESSPQKEHVYVKTCILLDEQI